MELEQCYLSAYRAKIAYLEQDIITTIFEENHFIFKDVSSKPKYFSDSAKGTQAYSWIKGGTLYITFRGTSDYIDVYQNLDLLLEPLIINGVSAGLVHRGFLECFRSLEHIIDDYIFGLGDINTIVFAGHSLGGAVATISAAVYGTKFPHIKVVCHTIGSPRVGNAEFVKNYGSVVQESVRVYNKEDPVPFLPASVYYKHVNGGLCLNDMCATIVDTDLPWYMRLIGYLFTCGCCKSFLHHSCDTYLDRLDKEHKKLKS
jgi:hypothetical protein